MESTNRPFSPPHRNERGQDLVEFALVLPLLLALLLGVIEFGILISNYNTVGNAAREGVRYGSTHPSLVNSGTCSSGASGVVGAACKLALQLKPESVTVTSTKKTLSSRQVLTVSVSYTAQLLTGTIIEAFGGDPTVTLQGSATMLLEQ